MTTMLLSNAELPSDNDNEGNLMELYQSRLKSNPL